MPCSLSPPPPPPHLSKPIPRSSECRFVSHPWLIQRDFKTSKELSNVTQMCVRWEWQHISQSSLVQSHPSPTPRCNPSMSIDSFNPHTVRQAQETIGTASGTVLRWSTQHAVSRVFFPSLSPYQLSFVCLVGFCHLGWPQPRNQGMAKFTYQLQLGFWAVLWETQSSKLHNISHMNCYPRVERSKHFPPSSSDPYLGVMVKVASSVLVNQLFPTPRKALIYSIGQFQWCNTRISKCLTVALTSCH